MRQLLKPIAAFVHCNRLQAPPGERLNSPLNSAHDDANPNCANFSKIILFHFMMESRVK